MEQGMRTKAVVCVAAIGLLAVSSCRSQNAAGVPAQPGRGSVRGHVRVDGPVPENAVVHMSADPMCNGANRGERVLDEAIVTSSDGSLANAFVELVGDLPDTPVPSEPVSIDQRGCVYRPRVIGLRVGQTLQVRNSDDGLHNVHGTSTARDGFNVGQPMSGIVNDFHPRDPGILRLTCDVHTWMVAFVGVVTHQFFAVTGADGSFRLVDVPAGMYTVRAWHERFETVVMPVRVQAGMEATADMAFTPR
jgi:plastocyanin